MSGVNYYQLLGIHATATDGEIRRAYRTLILKLHPDKRRTPDAVADELYRSIQEAYETLSCPEKRCLYDFVGSFAALAEVTASCPVQVPPGAGPQRRSGVAPDAGAGLWSRSRSGETLHSWGTSSLGSASTSRLSPCPSFDTYLSSSPCGGATTTGLLGSGPLGHSGNGTCSLAATCSDPATATATSGGGAGGGGQQAPFAASDPATAGRTGLGASAAGAAPPTAGYPSPHAHSHLQPQPHLHAHHPHLPHHHQPQQPPERRPVLLTELRVPNSAEPGGPPGSPHSSGGCIPTCANSPVTSPGTLLGKRRIPGADDPQRPQQPHTDLHLFPQPPPQPSSPQPYSHPHPLQQQLHSQDAAAGVGSCMSPTAARGAAAAAGGGGRHSADVHHRLLLTLEEMYSGCVKQLRLGRRVYRPTGEMSSSPPGATLLLQAESRPLPQLQSDADAHWGGHSCWRVEELFRVVVQPGWREGTKVTFTGKGDELPCGSRGDMVLVVAQAAHGRYERRGNDLHTVVVVPLVDALTGGVTAINTLDGRRLVLPLGPACLQPFSECVVKGEGMPILPGKARGARGGGAAAAAAAVAAAAAAPPPPTHGSVSAAPAVAARGNLHVRFQVSFPADLTSEQKAELRQALLQ